MDKHSRLRELSQQFTNGMVQLKWVLVDKTDQTTENGIVFADARFGTTGGTVGLPAGTIADLLASDFDADVSDPIISQRYVAMEHKTFRIQR